MISLVLSSIAAISSTPPLTIPSVVGTVWHYKAVVEWTVPGSSKVRTASLSWRTTVVASRKKGPTTIVVVSGFPSDLCWYQPGIKPKLSTLVFRHDGLWIERQPATQDAKKMVEAVLGDDALGDHYLSASPDIGDQFVWPDGVPDSPYRRSIEATAEFQGKKGWQVVLRTGPDDETLGFVPGVGVTFFQYNHHGTVASVRAHLLSVVVPRR